MKTRYPSILQHLNGAVSDLDPVNSSPHGAEMCSLTPCTVALGAIYCPLSREKRSGEMAYLNPSFRLGLNRERGSD